MKKILSIALTLGLSLLTFTGCAGNVIGSAETSVKTYDYSGFTSVKADSGFRVDIKQAETFSVKVTTHDNIFEYLDVTVNGDVLEITVKNHSSISVNTLDAAITMPVLEGVNLNEGSQTTITGFDSDMDFSVTIGGGSRLTGDIQAASIGFGISGGSTVILSGSADELLARSSGGSKLDLGAFQIHNADINIDSGGSAVLKIDGTLNTTLTAGSELVYIGEPDMGEINISGGSTLKKQ